MAVFVMTAPTVHVDEYSFTSLVDGVTDLSGSVDMLERKRADGGGYRHYLPGLPTFTATQTGYYDTADAGLMAEVAPSTRLTQRIVTATANNGATAGDFLISHRGYLSSVQAPAGAVGELATFTLNTQASDPPIIGVVGAPSASRTTSGLTGTAVALTGPTATQSLYACLHVTAAAGTNLVVLVQSDDNSGFTSATTRITFSTVSAVGAQWLSVAGDLSTETHWRITATIASGTFTFMAGFGVA